MGVNIIAPPMPVLVRASTNSKQIEPSQYAQCARQAGFDLISWTVERWDRIIEGVLECGGTFYFGLRRLFDGLRGIDTLIWALMFVSAVGLGPTASTSRPR
jgi:hypothetical protein